MGKVFSVTSNRNISLYTMSSGHQQVKLYDAGRVKNWIVSALVLTVFVGPRPEGDYHACHNNGNPQDNRLVNLRWDTRSGNELDKRKHGTHYEVNRTHCPRQHKLEEPNLVKVKLKRGSRECLACNRAKSRMKSKRWSQFTLQYVSDIAYKELKINV